MKQFLSLFAVLLLAGLLTSCGGSKTASSEADVERATEARRVYEAWRSVVDSRGTAETLVDLKENLADKQIYLDRWEMKYTDPDKIPEETEYVFIEKEWHDGKKFAVTAAGEVEEIAEGAAE